MRKLASLILALCLLLPLLAVAGAVPESATLVLDSGVDTALFLPDGRVVYVPWRQSGGESLPNEELRCLDGSGNLLWSLRLPAFRVPWGGLYQLSGSQFALIAEQLADGQRVQHIITSKGELSASKPLPPGLVPIMMAGDQLFGTRQGQEAHQLLEISPDGETRPYMLPEMKDNASLLWAWPRGSGHLMLGIGKLSQEEDFTKRTASQVLVYVDENGRQARHAMLEDKRYIDGFSGDAALNDQGGLTALVADYQDEAYNQFSVVCFDNKGRQAWQRNVSLDCHSVSALIIDQQADGSYTVYGAGQQTELQNAGFVFKLVIDREGSPQAFSARAAQGGWMVRYTNGQPYVFSKWPPQAWLAPFDAMPEIEMQLRLSQ